MSGLVNRCVPDETLDEEVERLIAQIISSGPDSIVVCKDLLNQISDMNMDKAEPFTAEVIANLRKSNEGQEGMDAFLNKRKPNWIE